MVSGVGLARQIEMRDLRQRVDPGIGAAGAVDGDALAAEALDGGFQDFLHRKPVPLALPADQAGAVIFERQLVAGHGRIVPGGMAKPRRNAGGLERGAPGALQPHQPQRALAAGDRQSRRRAPCRAAPVSRPGDLGRQHADALAL